MTGEVSLRGGVMPIGGLPEKLMAAQRAGIKQVFIPEENRDDLEDVAQEVKSALQIFPVKKVSDVLEKLDLHTATPEKKGKKRKAGIPADPFGNIEAFWGIEKNPISIRPVE
jgi:ATP-dependent Lon protease